MSEFVNEISGWMILSIKGRDPPSQANVLTDPLAAVNGFILIILKVTIILNDCTFMFKY